MRCEGRQHLWYVCADYFYTHLTAIFPGTKILFVHYFRWDGSKSLHATLVVQSELFWGWLSSTASSRYSQPRKKLLYVSNIPQHSERGEFAGDSNALFPLTRIIKDNYSCIASFLHWRELSTMKTIPFLTNFFTKLTVVQKIPPRSSCLSWSFWLRRD